MNRHSLIYLSIAVLSTCTLSARGEETLKLKTFQVSKTDGYRPVRPSLQNYLRQQPGKDRTQQHFCVIGYEQPTQSESQSNQIAWVHWIEGSRLVLWLPVGTDSGFPSEYTLLNSKRNLNLKKDVVSTPEEIGSSSYLVDRPWVDALIADCRKRGERFTLRRKH